MKETCWRWISPKLAIQYWKILKDAAVGDICYRWGFISLWVKFKEKSWACKYMYGFLKKVLTVKSCEGSIAVLQVYKYGAVHKMIVFGMCVDT